jgi:translation elongation factor EF-1alpha
MEINHKKVEAVKPGDDVALKVRDKVRGGDVVYKVDEET